MELQQATLIMIKSAAVMRKQTMPILSTIPLLGFTVHHTDR